jgi:glycerophosphoryl diester phosphodiesterase
MGASPVVIAHRGASGYLPEHTLPAKALAHGMGADFLEQDVVATRDGRLVVFHDLHLDLLTDVAARYPGRARPDGRHYCIDFTLAELRALRVTERRRKDGEGPRFPGRFPAGKGSFAIHTFEEELEFIQGLNGSTGRRVGVYAEVKDPAWHAAHGIDLGGLVVATLRDFGYRTAADGFYIQCFAADELRRLRQAHGAGLPLVQLMEEEADSSATALAAIAGYANAIGPALSLAWPDRGLVATAHRLGLEVHPYTFRADEVPAGYGSFEELLRVFLDVLAVDGLFTDFPDVVAQRIRGRCG